MLQRTRKAFVICLTFSSPPQDRPGVGQIRPTGSAPASITVHTPTRRVPARIQTPAHAGSYNTKRGTLKMSKIKNTLVALWDAEEGLTTVEYAIAGSLVAAAVVTAFTNLGTQVAAVINYLVGVINPPAS
jgi:pilus assembly protein Flp/PilA